MGQIQIPVDLGFAEFVSTLLSEVVSSIATAQSDQLQRLAELTVATSLSIEEFAASYVSDDVLDDHLAARFPSSDSDRLHDAVQGAPYQPPRDGKPEQPPFREALGVRLVKGDSAKGILSKKGANKIRDAARRQVAEQQQDTARALLERGVPRVVVDAGRISAKLTFEALQYREENGVQPEAESPPVEATSPTVGKASLVGPHHLVMAGRLPRLNVAPILPQVLEDVRLRVRPADDRRPETGSARSNVYGEVELTFKTVT